LQSRQSISKEAAKFDTVFREYLDGPEISNFTDDPQPDAEVLDNCNLSIYSNRRQAEFRPCQSSSMQDELFSQAKDSKVFTDFEELLSGAASKQFKTYDNSRSSDFVIVDDCMEGDRQGQRSNSVLMNMRLEQVGKTTVNRCISTNAKEGKPGTLTHGGSKVQPPGQRAKTKAKLPTKANTKCSPLDSIALKYIQRPSVSTQAKPSTPNTQLLGTVTPSLIRQQIDRLLVYTAHKQKPKAQAVLLPN
jgi:hypothetical protein